MNPPLSSTSHGGNAPPGPDAYLMSGAIIDQDELAPALAAARAAARCQPGAAMAGSTGTIAPSYVGAGIPSAWRSAEHPDQSLSPTASSPVERTAAPNAARVALSAVMSGRPRIAGAAVSRVPRR